MTSKYMVFVQGKSAPQSVHYTFPLAMTEAKRLAVKEYGRDVHVLKVCAVVRGEVGVVTKEINDDNE